jgi:hypothetical protein
MLAGCAIAVIRSSGVEPLARLVSRLRCAAHDCFVTGPSRGRCFISGAAPSVLHHTLVVDAIAGGDDNEGRRAASQAVPLDCRPSFKRTTTLEAEATLSPFAFTRTRALSVRVRLGLREKLIEVVSDSAFREVQAERGATLCVLLTLLEFAWQRCG